jgi:hypothetical protein
MAGKNASKKRQRPTSKKEEETQKYYDTLLHMCQKDLNKQAKTTKNFECQKLIRKLKEQDVASASKAAASAGTVTTTTNTNAATTNKNEVKLQQLRDLPMEPVIQECLRRLGILTLNPKPKPATSASDKATAPIKPNTKLDLTIETNEVEVEAATINSDKIDDESQNEKKDEEDKKENELSAISKDWIEKILQHKRMREILEKWIEKVMEYRRWCTQQEEGAMKKGKKNKMRHREEKQEEPTLQAEQLSNSLFVRLGDHPSDDDESDDEDGDGDVAEMGDQKKKNRPGQRARKAKFDAKQLRKEGPVPDSFARWMPSKKTTRHPNDPGGTPNRPSHDAGPSQDSSSRMKSAIPGTDANADAHPTGAAPQRPKPKPAGAVAEKDMHPSWKASKSQQAGIVAFQGKKTTFG